MREAEATVGSIVDLAEQLAAIVETVSVSSTGQDSALKEIEGTMSRLEEMAQRDAAFVEQLTAAATSLQDNASHLTKQFECFKLGSRLDAEGVTA